MYRATRFTIPRFNTETAPSVDGLRSVCVKVPDDPEFVRILALLVSAMTQATNWEGEQVDRDDRATRCLAGYLQTDWEGCVDCADVANCIETDEGVQDAISEQIINNIENNAGVQQSFIDYISENNTTGTQMPGTTSSDSMVPPEVFETDDECDPDKVWTGIQYLSEYVDGLCTDFFEVLAELDEAAKIAAKASGAIPVVGDYVQSAIEFALALKEKIAVTYAGESTQELRDSIACDWFCVAREGCGISIDQCIAVMATRLSTISPDEFGSVIDLMITGTFEGVQTVEMGYLLALTAMKFGQKFGDALGVRPLSQIIAIGASDPNDSWMVICPDCPEEWSYDIDLTTSDDTGIATVPFGMFVEGVGVVGALQGDGSNLAQLRIDVADWGDSTLTQVSFNAIATVADGSAFRGMIYVTGGTPTFHDLGGSETGAYTLTDDSPDSTPEETYLHISNTPGAYGVNTFTSFHLSGTGPNPFA